MLKNIQYFQSFIDGLQSFIKSVFYSVCSNFIQSFIVCVVTFVYGILFMYIQYTIYLFMFIKSLKFSMKKFWKMIFCLIFFFFLLITLKP